MTIVTRQEKGTRLSHPELDAVLVAVRNLLEMNILSEAQVGALVEGYFTGIQEQIDGKVGKEGAVLSNAKTSTPNANAAGEEIVNAQWLRSFFSQVTREANNFVPIPLTAIPFTNSTELWVTWQHNPDQPIVSHTIVGDDAVNTIGTVYDIAGLGSGESALLIVKRGPTAANATAKVSFRACNTSADFEVLKVANAVTFVTITRTGDTYWAESKPFSALIKPRLAAPTNFRPTALTPTSFTVEWDAVPGATKYTIVVTDRTDQGYRSPTKGSPTGTSFTKSTELIPGKTYYVSIKSEGNSAVVEDSEIKVITVVMPTS